MLDQTRHRTNKQLHSEEQTGRSNSKPTREATLLHTADTHTNAVHSTTRVYPMC